mgnify:CR=1 FL=1
MHDAIDHVGQHRVPRATTERHGNHRLTVGPMPDRSTDPDDAGRRFEYGSSQPE